MISISTIKSELKPLENKEELFSFIDKYSEDSREGVKSVIDSARKKIDKIIAEEKRMYEMFSYERLYPNANYIAGVDEVGRGPFAGPVVTCALILPKDCNILYINDSKKLSATKREELYDILTKEAVAYSIGIKDNNVIDEVNILQATYLAMQDSINNLAVVPDQILADAVTIPNIKIPQRPIIKGDAKSASIGAASIVAKVYRDRLMDEYDKIYPEYGFAKNKGYGTAEHIKALEKYGPTPIHRMSFIKNFI